MPGPSYHHVERNRDHSGSTFEPRPSGPHGGVDLARRLVHLESSARDLGFGVIRLETGTRKPEAIALYERSDYRRIQPFGSVLSEYAPNH